MVAPEFRSLLVRPADGRGFDVGRWLWVLEDAHRKLFSTVDGVSADLLDFRPSCSTNTVGTLLYHIAATDMAWLYEDILQAEFPAEVRALLPFEYRNEEGRLWPVKGISPDEHLDRLGKTRAILVDHVRKMSSEDLYSTRKTEEYEVSYEWILYHLAEHENYHRGQISELIKQARESPAV
ncbi:MAG: DinB family protein [Planctomycetota bacterium]|nr:DinB family protein [Planctomycetota bacterium]